MAYRADLLYTGYKSFWRTRTNLQVFLLYHRPHAVFEILVCDPALPRDESRLYVDYHSLRARLDHETLERTCLQEQEGRLQKEKIVDLEEIRDEVTLKFCKEELLSCLQMTTNPSSTNSGRWSISLDKIETISCPEVLHPFIRKR
jgi:hypothetical protein